MNLQSVMAGKTSSLDYNKRHFKYEPGIIKLKWALRLHDLKKHSWNGERAKPYLNPKH